MGAELVKSKTDFSPEREAKAVYKAIFTFKDDARLTYEDLSKILSKDTATLKRWNKDKLIPLKDKHLREAISNFIAIFRSLAAMFSDKGDRALWLKTPHPDLHGSPLDMMTESFQGLLHVRAYLDYVRGRGA
ncbi:MAG TPA: MbcA/ParS/Xre antitoxin family protein [Oligoflexus sp.]|uniref:MbcA/ParS/Xre antitoxin family protein n=1 Tax=Oligoflexus sp. TaxID=1971216 RepID=UPI002D5FC731|nr:MbcA/ParS/Xre antitoxin family protein [Oligoflexus sp.]HYX34761.1 MbcA/ParS/Xre antitoxin family protein [Oligoflexus sp.]